jgi:hypothetical protein
VRALDNPCALAVRAGSPDEGPYELYVSESGAGRVVAFASEAPDVVWPVVTGFPQSTFGDDPVYRIGPLGLAFLTRSKLCVGGGGLDDGQELVTVHALADDRQAVQYAAPDHVVGPAAPGPQSKSGEGNFFGLARNEAALFVASNGDDSEGWILKATIDANRLAGLHPFIPVAKLTGVAGPAALAVNPKPGFGYLLAGCMGPRGGQRDSQLAFFSPTSGRLALTLPMGLRDVIALAYSPSGNLYAADFSWSVEEEGGVFRIDEALVDGRQACRAVRIASVARPTALAFTPDGALWVAAFATPGPPTQESGQPSGCLLRISGNL